MPLSCAQSCKQLNPPRALCQHLQDCIRNSKNQRKNSCAIKLLWLELMVLRRAKCRKGNHNLQTPCLHVGGSFRLGVLFQSLDQFQALLSDDGRHLGIPVMVTHGYGVSLLEEIREVS
jgi:hypothetical protein